MTFNDIYECFRNDRGLLKYFDPLSAAINNEQASQEIYAKLVEYSKEYKCRFVLLENGYIFYAYPKWPFGKKKLISFCLKPEFRDFVHSPIFWDEIKKYVGKHFVCYLYSRNTRAISFLLKGGMKIKKSTDLITFLSI